MVLTGWWTRFRQTPCLRQKSWCNLCGANFADRFAGFRRFETFDTRCLGHHVRLFHPTEVNALKNVKIKWKILSFCWKIFVSENKKSGLINIVRGTRSPDLVPRKWVLLLCNSVSNGALIAESPEKVPSETHKMFDNNRTHKKHPSRRPKRIFVSYLTWFTFALKIK